MEFMEFVKKIADEISGELVKIYPANCTVSLYFDSDGYISVQMTEWEKCDDKKIEDFHRRELFDTYKISGEWGEDTSDTQNRHYAERGVLKED